MATTATDPAPAARPNEYCFVCGARHPYGLHLRFESEGVGRVAADWRPDPALQGFEGVIHGGIVSTVLDEAMSKAVAASGIRALTCDLRVRMRRSVTPGETLRIRGWIVDHRKRLVETEAVILDDQGRERAHAWASFLSVPVTRAASNGSAA